MNNQTRFMFLRNENNQPVGCLALQYDRDTGNVRYQVSTLNPHDRFNRDVGRKIAEGRLLSKGLDVKTAPELNFHAVCKTVLQDMEVRKSLPTRTVKAASSWLDVKGTQVQE